MALVPSTSLLRFIHEAALQYAFYYLKSHPEAPGVVYMRNAEDVPAQQLDDRYIKHKSVAALAICTHTHTYTYIHTHTYTRTLLFPFALTRQTSSKHLTCFLPCSCRLEDGEQVFMLLSVTNPPPDLTEEDWSVQHTGHPSPCRERHTKDKGGEVLKQKDAHAHLRVFLLRCPRDDLQRCAGAALVREQRRALRTPRHRSLRRI